MDRKKFLKLVSLASVGVPFMLNDMPSRFLNQFLDFSTTDCDDLNDRVLVIVRLAGANDGLNTVVPLNEYDKYADLRPNLKLKKTGTNAIITLDSTVSSDKLVGLHPSMTGFKGLYDAGQMQLFNGVGYPNPNYSHFHSEAIMYAGQDGTTSSNLVDGMFGRYLGSKYPGLANNPTTQNPDPLAITFNDLNPSLFYEHTHEKGIEYNVNPIQNSFFTNLRESSSNLLPNPSEYSELVDYIRGVEASMDAYYNRVMSVFGSGSNSSTVYPTSTLAKQLRTVARMIKGGSKTKIFQVNISGFDTHAAQVQAGNSHIGTHANLLADISNSIAAFQEDINALGFGDRVLTATFSEFGRRIKENGSTGTDHGDIAPFFIIGNAVTAGIMGDHPLFPNSSSAYYGQDQRRFDYRQLFGSILKDWLGADNTLMTATQLQDFVEPNTKVDIVKAPLRADYVCATLHTADINAASHVVLYPNPAKDFVKVDFSTLHYKTLHYSIHDVSGRKVLKGEESHYSRVVEINISSLVKGVYILILKTEMAEISKKIIVEK